MVVYTEVGAQARLEQHYRELYRATPAMLHTVDRHGRITNVSDRWLETLGYRREEVLGRVITEFMGKEMQATLGGGRLEDVIATGELENEPRTYVTKSGEVLEVEVSAHRRSRSERRRGRVARGVEGRHGAQSSGAPAARRIRGERAAARRARARARLPARGSAGLDEFRPHHRRESGAEADARAARSRRADVGERAHRRRVRRRQGARGARRSTRAARAAKGRS